MSTTLITHFPEVAIKHAKSVAVISLDGMLITYNTALGHINAIMNNAQTRESMSEDEQINIGCARERLFRLEEEIENIKKLLE